MEKMLENNAYPAGMRMLSKALNLERNREYWISAEGFMNHVRNVFHVSVHVIGIAIFV